MHTTIYVLVCSNYLCNPVYLSQWHSCMGKVDRQNEEYFDLKVDELEAGKMGTRKDSSPKLQL